MSTSFLYFIRTKFSSFQKAILQNAQKDV